MKKDCSKCDGKCCKYVVLEIDCPEDEKDFENIKWYVAHKNINVFTDDEKEWFIEFKTNCKYLNEKNLCKIYKKRPKICKEYSVNECTFHNEYKEKFTFKSIEDVENYLNNVWNKKSKSTRKFKSRKN